MPRNEVKIGQGMKELLKDFPVTSQEEWFAAFKDSMLGIGKGAKDLSITKYCPHLDKLITIKTDPPKCECMECIKEMEHGLEADNSDR